MLRFQIFQDRTDAGRQLAEELLSYTGRNGMHKYNNQDHAMMTAMLCAENIIANTNLYDLWQVNQDAEYHEAGDAPSEETVGTAIRLVPTRVTGTPELAPEG